MAQAADNNNLITFSSLKLDELFAEYLTSRSGRAVLSAIAKTARDLESGSKSKVDFDFSVFDLQSQPSIVRMPPKLSSGTISHVSIPTKPDLIQPTPILEPTLTQSDSSNAKHLIPPFYVSKINEKEVKEVGQIKDTDKITEEKLSTFLQSFCRLPACFAHVLLKNPTKAQQFELSNGKKFKAFWTKYMLGKDSNERFFRFVAGTDRNYVLPQDLTPFVRRIVETHTSLEFLKGEDQFQEKFIDFIVMRCFYIMDSDLRGTVLLQHFRKMDLATAFYKAEKMEDVNDSQHIFNYQHFYVAFCKFWDLDNDSDGLINKDDLMKFNDNSISPIIVERFFNSNFFPLSTSKNESDQVDFNAFVYFLMSSEDKTNLTSINFWYKLCDLDDDGLLSIQEIETLYNAQFERMRITGNETIPFDDIFRQLIDMISPAPYTVHDLVKSKMADVFFNTLFDLQKFLVREYQFPMLNPEMDELAKKLTPWEIYVLVEYDQLVNGNN